MIADASASMKLRAALAAATALGVAAILFVVTDSGSGGIRGMPASVKAIVGTQPLVVTLHGDVLALVSVPDVQALAQLEQQLGGEAGVGAEYGPARWLSSRIEALRGSAQRNTNAKVHRSDELVRDGASGSLSLTDETLTSTLVFGSGIAPVHSVRWLFPDASAARIFIKLNGSASRATVRRELANLIGRALPDVTETVSGG